MIIKSTADGLSNSCHFELCSEIWSNGRFLASLEMTKEEMTKEEMTKEEMIKEALCVTSVK